MNAKHGPRYDEMVAGEDPPHRCLYRSLGRARARNDARKGARRRLTRKINYICTPSCIVSAAMSRKSVPEAETRGRGKTWRVRGEINGFRPLWGCTWGECDFGDQTPEVILDLCTLKGWFLGVVRLIVYGIAKVYDAMWKELRCVIAIEKTRLFVGVG